MGNSESDINYQRFEYFVVGLCSSIQISRKESNKLSVEIILYGDDKFCKSNERKILNYIEDHKEMKLYNVNIICQNPSIITNIA